MERIIKIIVVLFILKFANATEFVNAQVIKADNAAKIIQKAILEEHKGVIYSLAWSPDGTKLASGSSDSTAKIWDSKTNKVLHTLKTEGSVWGITWTPDGMQLITVGFDTKINLWNAETGEKAATLVGPNKRIFCVAISPDGKKLVTGYENGAVVLFNLEKGIIDTTWLAHIEGGISTEVIAVAWSPGGNMIASGGLDYAIRLWNAETKKSTLVLRANTTDRCDINGLVWSSHDSILASASQDGWIRLWNTNTGLLKKEFSSVAGLWKRGVAWSPNGELLASTGAESSVSIWDPATGVKLAKLDGHFSSVWSVAWSPDGNLIATGGGNYESKYGDKSIRIWGISDMTSGIPQKSNSFDFQTYPNPFHESATISYFLEKPTLVCLDVFNTSGQLIKTLLNEVQQRGSYSTIWNTTDERGNQVSPGIYIFKFSTPEIQVQKKIIKY
jgi:WD40 repeat protein